MKIIGHRGAPVVAPENTMASFAAAWRAGADGVELDVRLTGDRELAVFHDSDGRRLAGVSDTVEDLAWNAVRTWRVRGQPVPRLADVLDEAPAGSLTLVEIKAGLEVIPALAPLLSRPRISHAGILSFDPEVAAMSRRCFPRVPVMLNVEAKGMRRLDDLILFAVAEKLDGLSIGWSPAMTGDVVNEIKGRGLGCAVWTVNDPEQAVAARRMGVDLLMTDDPATMIARVRHG